MANTNDRQNNTHRFIIVAGEMIELQYTKKYMAWADWFLSENNQDENARPKCAVYQAPKVLPKGKYPIYKKTESGIRKKVDDLII
jgi:hypothetical protein